MMMGGTHNDGGGIIDGRRYRVTEVCGKVQAAEAKIGLCIIQGRLEARHIYRIRRDREAV